MSPARPPEGTRRNATGESTAALGVPPASARGTP
jgi:hypothetical protein